MNSASFVPYCGHAPIPGTEAWNTDPILVSVVLGIAGLYALGCRGRDAVPRQQVVFAAGFLVTSAALISPLCNLSVALFSARVTQHMFLTLVAAPLVVLGRPERALAAYFPRARANPLGFQRLALAVGGPAFALAMWTWHMPGPYDATLENNIVYWTMHITTFGAALVLWYGLIGHDMRLSGAGLAVACGTGIQMTLLAAGLTLAPKVLFAVHYLTTWPWGLSPLQDQQLGGVIMWVPAGLLFTAYSIAGFGAWLNAAGAGTSIGPVRARQVGVAGP